MFRENSVHNQVSVFDSSYWMNPHIKEKLKKTWAPVFYEHVFCKIDEKPFAVLYSEIGRPNFPVNIAISIEFIKHFLNYTDDELIENFCFNYLVNYAVGIRALGELNFAERTLYEFRSRIYRYTIEHPGEDDLIFGQFINLLGEFGKAAHISMKEQRMDSTMFMSNIKKAGRLSLAFDVLTKAVKAIPKVNLTDRLKDVLKPDFRTNTLFKIKASETESKLEVILNLSQEAINILKSTVSEEASDALRIASRFISEQADIDSNTKRLVAKSAKNIPTNSLQSAYDEDATYRKKNDKSQSGYVANISETCNKDNPFQLITDYKVAQNNKSDVELIQDRLPVIKENTDCEKLYVDGGYYSDKTASNDIHVDVNFTDMTGRNPSDKIPVTDFELDSKTNAIQKCPNGIEPTHASNHEGQTVAHFDLGTCEHCELRYRCRAKKQKKSYVVRIGKKEIESAIQRKKIKENRVQNTSFRAGIEGTNSALKRGHKMDKLYVRGQAKSSVVVGLKIIAQNLRRFIKYMVNNTEKPNPNLEGIAMSSPV